MTAIELVEGEIARCEKLREIERNPIKTYYAFADPNRKTWFVTRTKFCPIKGTKLLFILGCKPVDKGLHVIDTYPVVGAIISDKDGNHIEVVEVKWS